MELLDKYEVACCDDDVVACFDKGVLKWFDNNNKDDFDGYFIHAHPLEYIIKETLGGKFLVHYGSMQKIV